VNTDQVVFGHQLAQYIADNLPNHSGNVIEVTGPPGQPVDISRLKGADQIWSKYPGIKIIAKYTGMWASDKAQTNTATQLTSLGKVDAIWCEGGTDGVIKAFLSANRPLPKVIAGEAENGFRQYMLGFKAKGVKATSLGQPPFLVLVSLELATEILQGKHAKANVLIPFPFVTQDTVKEGATTFKSLPSSFFADFTDSGPHATVQICVGAALNGTPCSGNLVIRLPK
jgi:ribose transport system substrate-binding protein